MRKILAGINACLYLVRCPPAPTGSPATAGPAAAAGDGGAAVLRELSFTDDGQAALRGTLKAALRLGHNYIGTEHVLLGILFAGGPAGQALASSGLDAETAERLLTGELAKMRAG